MVGAVVEDLGEDDVQRDVVELAVTRIPDLDTPPSGSSIAEKARPEGSAVLGRGLETHRARAVWSAGHRHVGHRPDSRNW
jgi:hypothetical protein